MRVTVYGSPAASAAVVVGSWNPLVGAHDALFARMRARAAQVGEAVVPVMLDPPPATFISGAHPLFEDAHTRLERLRARDVDAVAHVAFTREDVALGLLDLLAIVHEHLPVSRLWVGDQQSLGSGDRGNRVALIRAVARYRLKVDRLPPDGLKEHGRRVLAALHAGRVTAAARLAGRWPVVRRDALLGGERLEWAAGAYEVVPVTSPDAPLLATPLSVELEAGGLAADLPSDRDGDHAPYLAFVRGPGDVAAEATDGADAGAYRRACDGAAVTAGV